MNIYEVSYQKSQRHWCTLSISLQIHKKSKYWAATRLPPNKLQLAQATTPGIGSELPWSLRKQIQTALSQADNYGEESEISCSLSERDSIQVQGNGPFSNPRPTEFKSASPCQDALAFLHDLGCPQFFENQVQQIQMLDRPSRFASCINGILVYETRLTSSKPSAEFIYNIELLHCMDGAPGLSRLVGVVVDTSRKYLKSYLIEFPKARWRIDKLTQDTSVTWNRREKWARQLVDSIAHLHFKGFVSGMLCAYRMPVIIDKLDCVQLWAFKRKFAVGRKIGYYYPPEFQDLREASSATSEAECPNSTSKTDIFHLGLLLWALASCRPLSQSLVCTKSECRQATSCQNESHSRPITLPYLPAHVPQYYKDIVNACVAENPEDRPAARDLLAMFPAKVEPQAAPSNFSLDNKITNGPEDIVALARGISFGVACSHCGTDYIQQAKYFHCNVCQIGYFDVCQKCYDEGAHCLDRDHVLVEIEKTGTIAVAGKYHSSPKSHEGRRITKI